MLELKNISKAFPGVKALDNVSLIFLEGEIHALIGENGAGKSTIMNIICGIIQQDSGKIMINNKEVNLASYQDAINNDISLVNQEIQVVPKSTVAENIMLDKLSKYTSKGKINWRKVNIETKKYLEMVGLDISPETIIYGLSAAKKQLIQIAKSLASNSKFLLLDEPTSSLTEHEANNLFALLKTLKTKGVTIIFVSHKIEEVMRLCDKITVLRDGKLVGTKERTGLSKQDYIKMMIGRQTENKYFGKLQKKEEINVLEIENLSQEDKFNNINFRLKKGEILGFYGLVGSGRTELAKIIIGEDKLTDGIIKVNGKKAHIKNMYTSLNTCGIGYVTENRKEEGLILDFPITENITITIWNKIRNRISRFISDKKVKDITNNLVNSLDIRTPKISQHVRNLSGGNQQKVSISKWLAAKCDILIVDEPTVGVDVGAKEQIHEIIWNLANNDGKSIILISSDLPEMVTLARRILVFRENKIVGEIDNLDQYKGNYETVSQMVGQSLS